ncbi:MAG: biotin-dependent carboxylase-like uncharacterized protein [Rhodothermales bacterium]
MSVRVIKSGPLTTVQDLGRSGQARLGLSPGGAMDRRAFLWANRLLGNAPAAAGLEVTLGGLELTFESRATIAVTGGDCLLTVDGGARGSWRALGMEAGQTLRLGFARTGLRAYVAFPGGLKAPRFAGSASVVLREGLPGALGQAVSPGDVLKWNPASDSPAAGIDSPTGIVPLRFRPTLGPSLTVEFIPAYEWTSFSALDRETLLSADWKVTPVSDRIACRLNGPLLTSGPKVLDSAPLVDGTIQVLADGTPLVFMRDRPTIGGYAKLGAVLCAHLDRLAQARPGTTVRFVVGDAHAARLEAAQLDSFFGART